MQSIKKILTEYKPLIKTATKTLGLHRQGNKWVFVCNAGAIDHEGMRDDLVLLPDQSRMSCDIINAKPLTSIEIETIANLLFDFNVPSVTAPIVGWSFAAFFKPRIFHLRNAIPLLVVHGEPNSGKTETVDNIILPLFGLSLPIESIGSATQFTYMRELSSSNWSAPL